MLGPENEKIYQMFENEEYSERHKRMCYFICQELKVQSVI